MRGTTSLSLLVAAAVATPVLAFWTQDRDQDPARVDWQQHVRKACTSRRFGIRLAAARKVANGGDAAVPAVRAFAADSGWNAVPSSLVDAIADGGKDGPAVRALLQDWTDDDDFFWRSSAMRGIALRADGDADAALLANYADDPAWLMRTHARFGLALLAADDAGVAAIAMRDEADPRAPVRLARLLLEQGRTPPLQPLFDALVDERTFLDIPWGQRLGQEAHKTLKAWLGDAHPLANGGSFDDKQQAIRALRDLAQQKSGQAIALPEPRADAGTAATGGVEILSCKYGDQFVSWSDDGALRFGIDGSRRVELPAGAWRELRQQLGDLALDESVGVVICDSMRIRLRDPDVHVKVAPGSLPAAATEWLKRLAQSLEEAAEKDLAATLRRGLGQFAAR